MVRTQVRRYRGFGLASYPRSRTTWPLAAAVQTLLAASSPSTATTALNHHHRHVDSGHDDEGEDSKVGEASRSFTVLFWNAEDP